MACILHLIIHHLFVILRVSASWWEIKIPNLPAGDLKKPSKLQYYYRYPNKAFNLLNI